MKKQIVLIEWVDSIGTERWEYFDEIETMLPAVSHAVGFVIEDADDYITIALAVTNTQVLGRMTIPAGCIKNIKTLITYGVDKGTDKIYPCGRN